MSNVLKILAVFGLFVWGSPSFAKCGKTCLVTPLALDGDKTNGAAIKVWWPSGSEIGWYLMFTNRETLISISRRHFPQGDDASFNAYMFFNERHMECLHSDARYFWLRKNGKADLYVIQSTTVLSDKAEFHDDFTGGTVIHDLFKYDPDKDLAEPGNFQKIAEKQEAEARCRDDHLATDFLALFPGELSDGTIEAPPICAE